MTRHVPDPPWSYYHPFDNPNGGEPADILCDCGHRDFDEEVTEIEGRTVCVNCAIARDTDRVGDLDVKETGSIL